MSTATIPAVAPAAVPPDERARSIVFQDQIEIPLGIASLADFRAWARSDDFPERGRIDYIDGRIEVDLMVENLFYHGVVKAEIARVLMMRAAERQCGRFFIDATRVSHPAVMLSAEPDLVYIAFASIATNRVSYVPAKGDDPDSCIEIEGSPDWICEIVSDSSERKDTIRLAHAYYAAGVTEYFLVDARHESLQFNILRRGKKEFEITPTDSDGFQASTVFDRRYRLTREKGPDGHWLYHLDEATMA